MIVVHKVISEKYDSSLSIKIPSNEVYFTTGNKYKLFKDSCHLDIKKYSFSSSKANIWISLPNHIVNVNSTELIKT